MRLQKVLAAAGIGSRRACEDLIAAGRVRSTANRSGRWVCGSTRPRAIVHVDGARINVREDLVYLALNKPRGVLSAMSDSRGRPSVGDLVADRPERLFHVGRLDADSEGLLLLTNDGELAHRLMHPSFGVSKTYLATVPAPIGREVGPARCAPGSTSTTGRRASDRFRVVQISGGSGDRRGGAARGPQAHRAPAARRSRASGRTAGADRDRAGAVGRSASRDACAP